MSFAEQFKKLGIISNEAPKVQEIVTDPREIPRMYQAQVEPRCKLQFAGDNQDLDDWTQEWLYPKARNTDGVKAPDYQYSAAEPIKQQTLYRIHVDFPFRLYSDCGQDSIKRPVLGRNGVPFLPGSSIKGLFRRACTPAQAQKYCGNKESLEPGTLRFHGAYPVGDWGNCVNDVVHPQQPWQLGNEQGKKGSAYALISLYKPRMVFEFSTAKPEAVDWDEVEAIFTKALSMGVGGKTSTGYGRNACLVGKKLQVPPSTMQFRVQGVGVSSTLRTGVPEFRPNMFKAALRGHVQRLLAGVCDQSQESQIEQAVKYLFGSTDQPGVASILWQSSREELNTNGRVPTFQAQGKLYLDVPEGDVTFIHNVLRFAYIMGGFGKSWRRVWHEQFKPDYKKFAIGCHWISQDIDVPQTKDELTEFLDNLYSLCRRKMGDSVSRPISWRETWHPQRVAVYCGQPDTVSRAIDLFHYEVFKETPAVGGREPSDRRPTSTSSVWHRMLPIENGQYLEIVTVFYGAKKAWKDQLSPFIKELKARSLELAWGNEPQ